MTLESAASDSAGVDRHGIVAFLRRAIATAEALPRTTLHRRDATPAGIPLELWFDNLAEADLYRSRLAEAPASPHRRPVRLYVVNGNDTPAAWTDAAWSDRTCDAALFHSILAEAGLRGAYPFGPRVWFAFDVAKGVGLQLARSAADLPEWNAGAPLRQHLHWLLRAQGHRLAHAASLGLAGRGILLLGHGGAGKSATCLAGIAAGLQSVGDDYVALGGSTPPAARPLFRLVKQDRAGIARLIGLSERTAALPENWRGKVEFDPGRMFPDCFADQLRIDAIVLPHIARVAVPRFLRTSGGEAMRSLMRSNIYQFPGEPDDGFEYYGTLLRGLPVYRLELSENAVDNGTALADFVADLR